MRDIETIDSELQLVAALRRAARERGGPLPSIDVADALLDERRELTGLPRLTRCLVKRGRRDHGSRGNRHGGIPGSSSPNRVTVSRKMRSAVVIRMTASGNSTSVAVSADTHRSWGPAAITSNHASQISNTPVVNAVSSTNCRRRKTSTGAKLGVDSLDVTHARSLDPWAVAALHLQIPTWLA